MTLLWPEMLWLSLAVPAIIVAYLLVLRRKKKIALRYASLSMVQEAMGASRRLRRHIPPLIFLLALISMLIAISRPARNSRSSAAGTRPERIQSASRRSTARCMESAIRSTSAAPHF